MISVIICSRSQDISIDLKENISKTIGVNFEYVVIDNSRNEYNIFQAYNLGVEKANGDILCFMHEDILFHSMNWGLIVQECLMNKEIGLVGVVGGRFLSDKVIPWCNLGHRVGCIRQGMVNDDGIYCSVIDGPRINDVIESAVVVDGLWICTRRNIFDNIRFDDVTYNGFHCYDIDLCMQVLYNKLKVVVVRDVDIEHKSCGVVSDVYYKQLDLFVNKWKKNLPISRGMGYNQLGTRIYQVYRDIKKTIYNYLRV